MKAYLIIGFFATCLLACVGGNEKPKAMTGPRIYSQYCKQCHGAKGDLGLNGAANFRDSKLTAEERFDVIKNGRKTMLPYKGILTEEQIRTVAKYTTQLK